MMVRWKGVDEKAPQVGALVAKLEELSLIPRTYLMSGENCLQ